MELTETTGDRGVPGWKGPPERLCTPFPCPLGAVRCLGVFGGARYVARVHGPPAPCFRRAVRSQSVSDVRRPRRALLKTRVVRRRGEERTHGRSGRCSEPLACSALGAAVPGNFWGALRSTCKGIGDGKPLVQKKVSQVECAQYLVAVSLGECPFVMGG